MSQFDEAWTIQRVLTWSTDYLKGKSLSDSPRLDAELLLSHALGVSRIHLYTHFDKPLTTVEREPFKQFLMRRGNGEPVAYITGIKEFMGHAFQVSRSVLIPRPDTEVLVETALIEAAKLPRSLKILDIGTGSGCIAIALALRLKDAEVTAWDVDQSALLVAESNAQRLKADRVRFCEADALAASNWDGDPFDLIVSNPPYIAPDEKPSLAKSVKDYEPEHALFATADGLTFYEVFATMAARRLQSDGRLIVEIGAQQGDRVVELLKSRGWRDVTLKKDYAKLDRVIAATAPLRSPT